MSILSVFILLIPWNKMWIGIYYLVKRLNKKKVKDGIEKKNNAVYPVGSWMEMDNLLTGTY